MKNPQNLKLESLKNITELRKMDFIIKNCPYDKILP